MTEPATPSSKPLCRREDALAVVKHLRDARHVAYFAGGCVRDELLGIGPKDYDVATDAPPQRVRKLFSHTQAVGAAFGVILVRHGQSVVEVATFRNDDVYLDGRRPSKVHFTNAEEDARRRDFTINGLFLDPIENRVIDYVGGQKDLADRVVRAIGDPRERFAEDHLRMLRAIRFASRFGFQIAPETFDAIKQNAVRLAQISPERIAEELRLMLIPTSRVDAFPQLRETGLLDVIMRFLPERIAHRPDEQFSIFLAMGPPLHNGTISFGAALAGIVLDYRMHASGQLDPIVFTESRQVRVATNAMRTTLKISNEDSDALTGVLQVGDLLRDAPPSDAALKRLLAKPTAPETRLLLAALTRCGLRREQIEPLLHRLSVLEKTDFAPPSLLTGDDLVAAGWSPGPIFKKVLEQVYDAQLESRIKSKEEAMKLALVIAGKF